MSNGHDIETTPDRADRNGLSRRRGVAPVLFDPVLTDVAAIAEASAQAGYPAHVKG